jgi:hypothetical protein
MAPGSIDETAAVSPGNGHPTYLGLVDALDGDAVPGAAVGGGEGVAELAVAEEPPDLVPRLEVPVVAEIHPYRRLPRSAAW